MKRTFALLLAALLLASATACGSETAETTKSETDTTVQASETEVSGYVAPALDLAGDELHILNFDYLWNMYIYIDHEEQTGDSLNDKIYDRNRSVEEQFNCKLLEDEVPYTGWSTGFVELADTLINDVIAGTETYDAAYMCVSQRTELITKNYLLDLAEIDSLQLDGSWWHNKLNDTLQIGGKQYIASGALNLMPYDAMTSIFFNKDMHTQYGLDDYYTLVREGKWTLDKLIEDCLAVAAPNSDGKWDFKEGGDGVYGIALHTDFPAHFLYASGIQYVTEENGKYGLHIESDRMYAAAERISDLFDKTAGVAVGQSGTSGADFYETIFGNGRSLFLMDELKGGISLRDSDVDFGLLPAPKYTEDQESYITDLTQRTMFFCMPVSNTHAEETGVVIDALTYESQQKVVPEFFDGYIAHKGLRDEDSYEMAQIMESTMCMDVGVVYNWCMDLINSMNQNIRSRSPLASLIQSNKEAINTTIEEFIDTYMK